MLFGLALAVYELTDQLIGFSSQRRIAGAGCRRGGLLCRPQGLGPAALLLDIGLSRLFAQESRFGQCRHSGHSACLPPSLDPIPTAAGQCGDR